MKKALIFLVIILVGGGWTANKFLKRSNKSSEEKDRILELATNYNDEAKIFLTKHIKQHHDEAFADSYRMWKLSPVSELDLASHYDEQVYYRALEKIITEATEKQGQADSYTAFLDMGQFYGVPAEKKTSVSKVKTKAVTPPTSTTTKPEEKKESLLKKSKLGEKRTIPGGRRRNDDR